MEDLKKKKKEQEIVFSKAVKAGKRIYYLDVKRSRNNDLFLAITESKKRIVGTEPNTQVVFEKHKVFLYKEDFDKFTDALNDVLGYIRENLPEGMEIPERIHEHHEDIHSSEKEPEEELIEQDVTEKFQVDMDFDI